MIKHNRINGKYRDISIQIRKAMIDKYGPLLPEKLSFIVSDEDLQHLKLYKQYVELSLIGINRVLELFESKEE